MLLETNFQAIRTNSVADIHSSRHLPQFPHNQHRLQLAVLPFNHGSGVAQLFRKGMDIHSVQQSERSIGMPKTVKRPVLSTLAFEQS